MGRPLNTLEDWKEKIGEYNLDDLAEAGWALETLIDEIIYLRQKVSQLQSIVEEPKKYPAEDEAKLGRGYSLQTKFTGQANGGAWRSMLAGSPQPQL